MGKYEGYRCAHCNEIFSESDDVVVCPICGAPHHRKCYIETGKCAAENLHETGESYNPVSEKKEELNKKTCPRCGHELDNEAVFCPHCKTDLRAPRQERPIYQDAMLFGAVRPDDTIDGVKAKDLAEYVGPSSGIFLQKWKIAEKNGSSFSLNIPALLFGPFYYLYRRMNLLGIVFLIFRFISNIPYAICTIAEYVNSSANLTDWAMLADIFSIIGLAVNILAALFFNKLYLSKAVAEIKNPDKIKKGGVSMPAVLIGMSALFAASFILSYFLII